MAGLSADFVPADLTPSGRLRYVRSGGATARRRCWHGEG